jgi:hypothetical protein
MRAIRVLFVFVLVVAVFVPPANATPDDPPDGAVGRMVVIEDGQVRLLDPSRLSPRFEAGDFAGPQAVMAAYRQAITDQVVALAGARAARQLLQANAAATEIEFLQGAGDFDGDGLDDVLGMSFPVDDDGFPTATTLIGRRGTDGAELWRQAREGFAFGIPTAVGPDGAEGVLVVGFSLTEVAPEAIATVTMSLAAMGGDGSVIWQTQYTGAIAATPVAVVATGLPNFDGLLEAADGRAAHPLVSLLDVEATGLQLVTRTQLVVVDGADGGGVSRSEELGIDTLASGYPVGDLDGDALDDYVVLVGGFESTGDAIARSSASGAERWRTADVPVTVFSFAQATADPTGDGVEDVLS